MTKPLPDLQAVEAKDSTDNFYEGDEGPNLARDPAFVAKYFPDRTPSQAMHDVMAERFRQVEKEGWTATHDDAEHYNGEMAKAAACYAIADLFPGYVQRMWPWDDGWWKPTTERRNLIKAAALIVAEIERLDRAKDQSP